MSVEVAVAPQAAVALVGLDRVVEATGDVAVRFAFPMPAEQPQRGFEPEYAVRVVGAPVADPPLQPRRRAFRVRIGRVNRPRTAYLEL